MKTKFVQFACDIETLDLIKYVAIQKHITLSELCRQLIFEYLLKYSAENINKGQEPITQEEEELLNGKKKN